MNQAELELVDGGTEQSKLVGQTIDGRYEVQKVLGEGGMGLVYRARHIVLNKPLAIKVLRPDVSRDEEIITRFRQEAQSASAIGNQHIIDISDFGTLPDGSTYFVMEFLDGVDLTGAIEQAQQVDPRRLVHIAKQLCVALGAAHEAGIVHRDLKPDNIYLIKRGGDADFVQVLAFGIAKVGGSSSKLTRAGQVFGTPHYMSPEQCSGTGVDHRTDVYALGIILFEMVTGQVPYDADNLMGILTKHLYEPIPSPRTFVPELPADLEAVIVKSIAKNADERYQNMTELYEDLLRVEQGVGTVAIRETTKAVALPPAEEDASALPTQGSKLPLVLAIVATMITGGIIAYVGLMSDADDAAAQITNDPVGTPSMVASPSMTLGAGTPTVEPTDTMAAEMVTEMAAAPMEEVAAPEVVAITSEPDHVEVFQDGVLVGTTPLTRFPKPSEGFVDLELRQDGYESQTVRIASFSPAELHTTLERRRRRSNSGMRASSEMAAVETMEAAPSAMMAEAPSMMRAAGNSEVLNPWGSN